MRRCRAALTALTLALFSVLISVLVAGPASAGGPTSVLLVMPGVGNTASLYTDEAEYQTLARLVGAFDASGVTGKVDKSGASHEYGSMVTVTWLIHDVQVWRVDRIWLGADDGPWVSTQVSHDGSESIWERPVVWHTASDGPALTRLLDELGVSDGSHPGVPGSGSGGEPASAEEGTAGAPGTAAQQPGRPEQPATQPAGSATSGSDGAVWGLAVFAGLAGLALGVALTVAATRLRRGPRFRQPAHLGPSHGELDWSFAEELSSSGRQAPSRSPD